MNSAITFTAVAMFMLKWHSVFEYGMCSKDTHNIVDHDLYKYIPIIATAKQCLWNLTLMIIMSTTTTISVIINKFCSVWPKWHALLVLSSLKLYQDDDCILLLWSKNCNDSLFLPEEERWHAGMLTLCTDSTD